MRALVAAIDRQKGAEQALQAHAIRTAVWAEQEGFVEFVGRLTGARREPTGDAGEADAALAAFGLSAAGANR